MGKDLLKLIEVNPKIMFGKPVITGTRIPVDIILEKLAYGNSLEEILTSYPNITRDAIYACLLYATLQIRNENIYSIAS
jgi:uncharacterized protein (DUF433 family)